MEISYRTILKKQNYRHILLANLVNRLGDSIDTLAFSWLVYAFTGEGKWAALVFAVNKIPSVIFLPFAGAYVEKKEKKYIMILCDVIRALLVTILLICMITKTLSVIILVLFSFFISLAEAFRIPAGVSFITQLLDKDELSYGVSLNVLVSMIAGVVGTGIGGLMISYRNMNVTFEIDIATFLVSIVLITVIPHSEIISNDMRKENSLSILKEGLQYIIKRKVLVYVILFAGFANGIMAPIDSLQTPVVVEIFKQDAAYVSLLNICLTIGVLFGGAVYPILQKKVSTRVVFTFSCAFIMFLYLLVSFVDDRNIVVVGIWYYGIIVCYFLYGLFAGFLTTGVGITLMKHTEQTYMSRTNTIFTAIGEAAIPLASTITGLLLHFLEMKEVFWLVAGGIFMALLSVTLIEWKNKNHRKKIM